MAMFSPDYGESVDNPATDRELSQLLWETYLYESDSEDTPGLAV